MTAVTSSALADLIRGFIAEQAGVPVETLEDGTELLDAGLLTSLQAMELLLHVEEWTGRPLPLESIDASTFASISALVATLGDKP